MEVVSVCECRKDWKEFIARPVSYCRTFLRSKEMHHPGQRETVLSVLGRRQKLKPWLCLRRQVRLQRLLGRIFLHWEVAQVQVESPSFDNHTAVWSWLWKQGILSWPGAQDLSSLFVHDVKLPTGLQTLPHRWNPVFIVT